MQATDLRISAIDTKFHALKRGTIENLIESRAKEEGIAPQKLRASLERENPSRRLGEIAEFGFACAWICSAHSGYLVGQNILLDGGVFNSTH